METFLITERLKTAQLNNTKDNLIHLQKIK